MSIGLSVYQCVPVCFRCVQWLETDGSVTMEELVKHLSRCQHMGWMNVIGELMIDSWTV